MQLVENITDINENIGLLIGNFDGVHLGHQKLIEDTLKDCKNHNLKLLVVSFVPHPVQILKPRNNFLINTYRERRELLELQNVDYFKEIPFDRDLSTLCPGDFLDKYIFLNDKIKKFYLGYDFAFGANKEGDSEFVANYCKEKNIEFSLEKKFLCNLGDVSSSIVRETIDAGEIQKAQNLLGRPFFLYGRIIKGAGRGKKIGFPTANIEFEKERIVPKKGVYVTQTITQDLKYLSITNIGNNPTFTNDNKISVETHLLDFDRDIYGESIKIIFHCRLRDEKKFESVNELIEQIRSDEQSARKYFQC